MTEAFDLIGIFICGGIVGFCVAVVLVAHLERKYKAMTPAPSAGQTIRELREETDVWKEMFERQGAEQEKLEAQLQAAQQYFEFLKRTAPNTYRAWQTMHIKEQAAIAATGKEEKLDALWSKLREAITGPDGPIVINGDVAFDEILALIDSFQVGPTPEGAAIAATGKGKTKDV